MTDLLSDFAAECSKQGVRPAAALESGGVNPSLWYRWNSRKVSPTLANFEAAKRGLVKIVSARNPPSVASSASCGDGSAASPVFPSGGAVFLGMDLAGANDAAVAVTYADGKIVAVEVLNGAPDEVAND